MAAPADRRVRPFFVPNRPGDKYDLIMATTPQTCTPETLVLVDDNALFLRLLSKWAEDAGFEPRLASSAYEAMEILADVRSATVVSDGMMPGMDGTSLCRELRERFRDGLLYFVLVTGDEDPQAFAAAAAAGVDDFLTKPVRKDQFVARLQVARRLHATCDELSSSGPDSASVHAELESQLARIEDVAHRLLERGGEGDAESSAELLQVGAELRRTLGL